MPDDIKYSANFRWLMPYNFNFSKSIKPASYKNSTDPGAFKSCLTNTVMITPRKANYAISKCILNCHAWNYNYHFDLCNSWSFFEKIKPMLLF